MADAMADYYENDYDDDYNDYDEYDAVDEVCSFVFKRTFELFDLACDIHYLQPDAATASYYKGELVSNEHLQA